MLPSPAPSEAPLWGDLARRAAALRDGGDERNSECSGAREGGSGGDPRRRDDDSVTATDSRLDPVPVVAIVLETRQAADTGPGGSQFGVRSFPFGPEGGAGAPHGAFRAQGGALGSPGPQTTFPSPAKTPPPSFDTPPAGFPASAPSTARFPPLVPLHPPPDLGGALNPMDLLLPAVREYWDTHDPMYPIVHRQTFEEAFNRPSAVYSGRVPTALLFALAASGARLLTSYGDRARVSFSRWCVERVRELLLARSVDGLETAQTLVSLLDVVVVGGQPQKTAPVIIRAAKVTDALFRLLPSGPPANADAWVYRESVLRARIIVAAPETGMAHFTGRPTIAQYFHKHAWPVPCGEAWFIHPNREEAFGSLVAFRAGSDPSIQFGASSFPGIARTARALARAALEGSASVMCLFQLSNYLRHLISYSLRTHASDPHRLRTAAASLAACADAAPTVLPPDLGVPLSHGDAAPLLSRSVFPTPMHAQSALQSLLCAEGHASEVLLAAGFRTAGAARCLRFSRMLACFLRADPELRRGHFVLLAPTFAAGKVLLAEAALLRGVPPEGEQPWERTERMRRAKAFEGGARTVARALRRLASGYGFQARRVSEAFDAAMLESGLVPALPGGGSSSSLGPEEWEEAADSDFIADVLLLDRGERGAVLGRAVSGSVASVLASSLEGGAGKGPGSGSGTSSVDVGVV